MLKNTAAGVVLGALLVLSLVGVRALAAAPSGFSVVDKVSAPLQDPPLKVTRTVSTTKQALFYDGSVSNDLAGQKLDSVVQNITVESDAANTARVCVQLVDMTPGTNGAASSQTCDNAFCVAATYTCNDGANDGEWIDPGEVLPLRPSGVVCACVVAEVGTPLIQAKRVAR